MTIPQKSLRCECGNRISDPQWGLCEECRFLVSDDDEYFDPDLELKTMRELRGE